MSLQSLLEQQVKQNVDRAKRTKEISEEYAPSAGQVTNFLGMLAPGAGITDAAGEYPALPSYDQPVTEAFSNEPYPSMDENLARGGWGYLDAGLQGLGVAGDALYAAPYVGPPLGATLKGLGALGAVMRAGSKAGKGAKTETGIATLGKEPMFTPEDTLNLAYTPDGSYSPAIKDLIEKAPPNLKGQGIVQWANKNLKPKELEFLGIDEFIKDNPKATLRETVEGVSGNKVVVGKKILSVSAGEGNIMDFDITTPLEDPLDGSLLYQYKIDDIEYDLDRGNFENLQYYANQYAAQRMTPDELASYGDKFTFEDVVKRTEKGLESGASNETLDDVIDQLARIEYENAPYELMTPTGVNVGEDTFAFGDGGVGYELFVKGERVTDPDNIAYSRTEAQIQLRDKMADEGYDFFRTEAELDDPFYDFEGAAQYKQFIDQSLPGGENYREILYTFEGAPETHRIGHFADDVNDSNYLAHALVRDRKLADGTESLHGDELQSDLHKEGAKYGYKTPENIEKIQSELSVAKQKILKQADTVEDMLIKKGVYTKQEPSMRRVYDYSDGPEIPNNQRIANELNEIRKTDERGYDRPSLSYSDTEYATNRLKNFLLDYDVIVEGSPEYIAIDNLHNATIEGLDTSQRLESLVPNYPYKDDYHEMAIKKMLLQAVEEGKPAISVSGSAPIKARYVSGNDAVDEKNFRFYENLYDKKIPSYMQKLANKYGGEFQKNSKLDFEDTFGGGRFPAVEDEGIMAAVEAQGGEKLYEANVIKITEEMRNKILLEGIPDFATGGIVNKGIARLRTAKQPTEGIVDLGLY